MPQDCKADEQWDTVTRRCKPVSKLRTQWFLATGGKATCRHQSSIAIGAKIEGIPPPPRRNALPVRLLMVPKAHRPRRPLTAPRSHQRQSNRFAAYWFLALPEQNNFRCPSVAFSTREPSASIMRLLHNGAARRRATWRQICRRPTRPRYSSGLRRPRCSPEHARRGPRPASRPTDRATTDGPRQVIGRVVVQARPTTRVTA